jgi:hypothetical protein
MIWLPAGTCNLRAGIGDMGDHNAAGASKPPGDEKKLLRSGRATHQTDYKRRRVWITVSLNSLKFGAFSKATGFRSEHVHEQSYRADGV